MKSLRFQTATAIAAFLGVSAKTVRRRARADGWPSRRRGNRTDYAAPRASHKAASEPAQQSPGAVPRGLRNGPVANEILAEGARMMHRKLAVEALNSLIQSGVGPDTALLKITRTFRVPMSVGSLRRWASDYRAKGLGGLAEQKRGVVGRKRLRLTR